MNRYPLFFFPLSLVFIIAFFLILIFLFLFVYLGMISVALTKLGISPSTAFLILFLSIWGSMINIPIKVLSEEPVVSGEVVSFFGVRYVIPVIREGRKTILAVNLGGAVVPVLLSLYIVSRIGLTFDIVLATLIVTVAVKWLARPVRGVGIAMPAFIPPLLAAFTALILSPDSPAGVAYIAGTMGTLIGADILNIKKISGLGAPVASIGGAGTFDGIFLTGILAVILS